MLNEYNFSKAEKINMNTTDKVQVGDSTTGTSTSTSYTINSKPSTEYGWACPRCGRINAPWKSQCDCLGGNWYPTWEGPYYDEWWKHVTCTLETTWKAPSSVCGSDSSITKQDLNSTIYTTAHNPVVSDSVTGAWVNVPKTYTNSVKR